MMQIKIIEHFKRGDIDWEFNLHSPDDIEAAAKIISASVKAMSDYLDGPLGPGDIQFGMPERTESFAIGVTDEPETVRDIEPEPVEEETYDRAEKKSFRITKAKIGLFKDKTGIDDEKLARQWITEAEGDADKAVAAYLAKYPTPEVEEIAEHAETAIGYSTLCEAIGAAAQKFPATFLADFQNYLGSKHGVTTVNVAKPETYADIHKYVVEYQE